MYKNPSIQILIVMIGYLSFFFGIRRRNPKICLLGAGLVLFQMRKPIFAEPVQNRVAKNAALYRK